MEFGWTPEQDELYQRALTFAQERLGRTDGSFRERWRVAADFGFLGLCVPPEHGGLGLDALSTARVVEALGKGCPDMGINFSIAAHLFAVVMPLLEHGSAEQRAQWLPKLCSGEWVGANASSEADAGSDVYAMKARAVAIPEGYRLTGAKSFVSNGPEADLFLVYAVTNPSHGYLGMSAFAVERGTPGLTVGKPFVKSGLRSSPMSSLYLEDCVVPASARVGMEGQGAILFRSSMRWERACLFAAYVGSTERVLETSVEYAKTRKQFGKPIGAFQGVSHKIAEMKVRLESARLLLYRACWCVAQGQDATLEIALAKVAITDAALQAGLDAVQIHGALGVLEETGLERAISDALPARIFSGSTEVQKNLIASRLGL